MRGKYAYLKLRGLVLEAGQPHVECLLWSRELLLQTQRSTEALLTIRKSCMLQRKKIMLYWQLRDACRALKLERIHLKSFTLFLNPVLQHDLWNIKRCLYALGAHASSYHHSYCITNFFNIPLATFSFSCTSVCTSIHFKISLKMYTSLGCDQNSHFEDASQLLSSVSHSLSCLR